MKVFTDRQLQIMEAATKRISDYGIQYLTIKSLASDLGLSEPALYRHFSGKNDILLNLLEYFKNGIEERMVQNQNSNAAVELKSMYKAQLKAFSQRPEIVGVVFSEGIFHFDPELNQKTTEIINLVQDTIKSNIEKGQLEGDYKKSIDSSALTVIVTGAIRMTIVKWRLSNYKSDLISDSETVLDEILKLIGNK